MKWSLFFSDLVGQELCNLLSNWQLVRKPSILDFSSVVELSDVRKRGFLFGIRSSEESDIELKFVDVRNIGKGMTVLGTHKDVSSNNFRAKRVFCQFGIRKEMTNQICRKDQHFPSL